MNLGTSTVDITPHVGCELSGFLSRTQPSTGILDQLACNCLYLESDGKRLLWLHADLVGFERQFVCEVKKELHEQFDLQPEQIVLSATHTHSGPATLHLNQCGEYDETYIEWLKTKLFEAAASAISKQESVEMVIGEGHCNLAIDRRGKASAHIDRRVGIVGWKRSDETYAAVLANYPIHNVALGGRNRKMSGDLAGIASAILSERLSGQPTVLLTNGACGNLNPPNTTSGYNTTKDWARILAESIIEELEHAGKAKKPTLDISDRIIHVPLDTMSADQIESMGENNRKKSEREQQALADWKRNMLEKLRDNILPTHVEIELQVIKLANVYLVCLGAEVFPKITDNLREATGQTVYVIGFANGEIGYLPTRTAYDEGGYEVNDAFVYYNSFRPKPGAFETVCSEVETLIVNFRTF